MRWARPVRWTASARISPPSTSHSVAEANPENTICGGATASTIASRKNRNPVMCSGSVPLAHNPTVNTSSAAACMVVTVIPCGGGSRKITVAPTHTSAAKNEESRGIKAQRRGASGFELRSERVGAPREHADVGGNRDEQVSHVEAALAVGLADQDARCFARLADFFCGFLHHLPHFGVLPVTDVAHVGRQVVGADEHAIHAVHRSDRLDAGHRLACLDLH